ncbi:hypothetical protein TH63_00345 [Rufibacter radiotolerans]|uniref:Restriction endonuclease n=1 Tax=Rufibacter radiotolerans TaxID=1379910 RepID=A0A0H4VKY9_9BACT|nr:HNH endonuclease [Rufibacter radiotolerans]AKQ44434.1 hypothetical protein TH63_00345 [Rufibacter radiotolerans]
MYTIITENDVSEWDDRTGTLYHFPNRYLKFLQPETSIIYYKGKLKNKDYRNKRLTDSPHYFAVAKVEEVFPDPANSRNHFCTIKDFTPFGVPILAKVDDEFLESIPSSRESNYWRDGVRPITEEVYQKVLSNTIVVEVDSPGFDSEVSPEGELESYQEGDPKKRYTTIYERNSALRQKAIEVHGTTCQACHFNFKEFYGEIGEGYIHVHHLRPISDAKERIFVNPKTDLCVLCPNCHAIVHRTKHYTLSLEQVKALISSAKLCQKVV